MLNCRRTESMINILMAYVINTGLLTSLCGVCSFISVSKSSLYSISEPSDPYPLHDKQFVTMPHNYIYIAFYFSLPKR